MTDGDDCVEALLPRDVEVIVELLDLKVVTAGLGLDQRGPSALTPRDPYQSVRSVDLAAEVEGHLDEGLDRARRRAAARGDSSPELLDRGEDGEQHRTAPPLLLVGVPDAGDREQPGTLPLLVVRHPPSLPGRRLNAMVGMGCSSRPGTSVG